ncbi:MAG: hypothetical protein V1914_04580 [archaeon]
MDEFKELREEIKSFEVSTGNGGVINDDQQCPSTMINNDQQSSTMAHNDQQLSNEENDELEPIGVEYRHLEPVTKQSSTIINNDQQSSTIINNDQQSSTMINNHQQSSTVINDNQQEGIEDIETKIPLGNLKKDLDKRFKELTDREFSVFMAVYQLEEQLPDVNYTDVARMLKISEMTIRGYVNTIISKKIPLEKHRMYNKKVFLGISKEFRELNLASFLLTLRLPKANFKPQKTLKGY